MAVGIDLGSVRGDEGGIPNGNGRRAGIGQGMFQRQGTADIGVEILCRSDLFAQVVQIGSMPEEQIPGGLPAVLKKFLALACACADLADAGQDLLEINGHGRASGGRTFVQDCTDK